MNGDQPVGRIRFMNSQRVNLDGFAVENADLGLVALRSPYDPEPSVVQRGGAQTAVLAHDRRCRRRQ